MFAPWSPAYRPSEWELAEAARRGISVRTLWGQLYAESTLAGTDDEDEAE